MPAGNESEKGEIVSKESVGAGGEQEGIERIVGISEHNWGIFWN